ncbi:MAG TPA: hypothetical protein VNN13_07420 [Methylomirabilota bacterium]|nr:hypothetical protein [Methylomirabilota bacterium]
MATKVHSCWKTRRGQEIINSIPPDGFKDLNELNAYLMKLAKFKGEFEGELKARSRFAKLKRIDGRASDQRAPAHHHEPGEICFACNRLRQDFDHVLRLMSEDCLRLVSEWLLALKRRDFAASEAAALKLCRELAL